MNTDHTTIVARLTRLVLDADRSADEAERELGAALADLDAAHKREDALAGDLIQARRAIDEQAGIIAGLQHALALTNIEHQLLRTEIDRLVGERMGSLIVVSTPLGGWRN